MKANTISSRMRYLVEFMEQESAVLSQDVEASTAFVAATKAARGSMVHFNVNRSYWIKVTGSGEKPFEFGVTVVEVGMAPRRPIKTPQRRPR